jgi:TolB-like protein
LTGSAGKNSEGDSRISEVKPTGVEEMTRSIMMSGVLLLAMACGRGVIPAPAAAEEISHGRYFYDIHHPVPADYVYRTGRLFFQPSVKNSAGGERGRQEHSTAGRHGQELVAKVGALTRQLLVNSEEEIADHFTVAVSSFVNLNDLYRTSALGRYLSEQLMGELQVAGVSIIELRQTPSILISKEHGEFNLSRDMNELAFIHHAHATLVGTYTAVEDQLFLNARLLRNRDSKVLSSAALVSPLDPVTRGLLADEATPAVSGAAVKIRDYRE